MESVNMITQKNYKVLKRCLHPKQSSAAMAGTNAVEEEDTNKSNESRPLESDTITKESGTLVIPKEHHRCLIGKKGKVLQQLELKTDTKILIPGRDNPSNKIRIFGTKEALKKAKQEILLITAEQESVTLIIPKEHHRCFLGKKGKVLRELELKTYTKILIPGRDDPSNKIRIFGTKEALEEAKNEILLITAEQSRDGNCEEKKRNRKKLSSTPGCLPDREGDRKADTAAQQGDMSSKAPEASVEPTVLQSEVPESREASEASSSPQTDQNNGTGTMTSVDCMAQETVWFQKHRYEAERRFYELMYSSSSQPSQEYQTVVVKLEECESSVKPDAEQPPITGDKSPEVCLSEDVSAGSPDVPEHVDIAPVVSASHGRWQKCQKKIRRFFKRIKNAFCCCQLSSVEE